MNTTQYLARHAKVELQRELTKARNMRINTIWHRGKLWHWDKEMGWQEETL
jgi:hypothetical protein